MTQKIYFVLASPTCRPGKIYQGFVGRLNAQGLIVGGGTIGGFQARDPKGQGLSLVDHQRQTVLDKLQRKLQATADINTLAFNGFGLAAYLPDALSICPQASVYVFRHYRDSDETFLQTRLPGIVEHQGVTEQQLRDYLAQFQASVAQAQAQHGMTAWRRVNKPSLDPDSLQPNYADVSGQPPNSGLELTTLNV